MANTFRRWWNAWREGLSWLPLLFVALLLYSAAEGLDWKILLWREAYVVLVPLAVIGALCARSLNRTVSGTPLTAIRSARPGYVALRGQAQPLPDRPLNGPDSGLPCVWFHYSYTSGKHFNTRESRRPFRLLDGTGEVLVMPADAEVQYGGEGAERRIEPGDQLYVLGELRPAIETPPTFAEPDGQFGQVRIKIEAERQEAWHEADAWVQELSKPVMLPRLPSVVLPRDGRPFLISAEDRLETKSRYSFLMRANVAIAVVGLVLFPFTHYLVLYQ